jgi:anti-sigma B factor antagonist
MHTVIDRAPGLSLRVRSEGAYVIAVLTGELNIASAPALREQLLNVLRPAVSRLILDLSAVSYADASGLAVLVGTGRRAGLLGGFLRLAAPGAAVTRVLRRTGLYWQFDIFPSVRAAITGTPAGRLSDPANAQLTALGAVAAQRRPA